MGLEYSAHTALEVESNWYKGLCQLHGSIFDSGGSGSIQGELAVRPKFLILVASHGGRVVGFKIGYQDRKWRFYSWLGGVDPDYRKQGIASELMRRQHEWCKEQGYEVIRTQTKNKWRSMLILNLRHGMDIVGTYTDERGEPKIILEKRLS